MTPYLQRLFDRAAGLAAGPATALSPTFSSRSPVAEADQRLNVPDLAASLFALSPSIDAPSLSEDEALASFEEALPRQARRNIAPPIRTTETLMPPLADPPIAVPTEPPPLLPQGRAATEPQRPASPDRPVLTPAPAARDAAGIIATETPPPGAVSAAGPDILPPREQPAPLSAAELPLRPVAPQPIPPPPRAVPDQAVEPAALRESPQPRRAEIAAMPADLSATPSVVKSEERVTRQLEPVPLPAPEPLPAPAPPPRDAAELRQPTVTRREIVTAPAPEPIAQQPSRAVPATAESVSRIGKLMPRRRAQLVFGLRRR